MSPLSAPALPVYHPAPAAADELLGEPAAVIALPLREAAAAQAPRRTTDAAAATAAFLFIMGSAGALAPGASAATFLAALAVSAVGLALLYLVDGFASRAFTSARELTRAVAGASGAGASIALALAWQWPQIFSPLFAAELVIASAAFGYVVAGAAVGPAGVARGRRARALIFGTTEASVDERVATRVDIVGRVVSGARTREISSALAFHRPDVVLVTGTLADVDFDLLRVCSEQSIRVLVLHRPTYGAAASGRVVRLGGLPWLHVRPLAIAPRHLRAKRALDLAVIALAAPIVLPVAALVAAVVGTTSRGGIIYRQVRLGEGGRRFVVLKFRTMCADAEAKTGAVFAGADDPRVTRVGGFLRRVRLDELPQLWNIVRGDMTVVGPRPERPEFASDFAAIREYDSRHLIRPGLTGLAQLVGGYSATASDKLRCDLLYLSSRSLRVDLRLIGLTALDLVRGFPGG